MQLKSVIDSNSIKRPVINNSKRSTQKYNVASSLIILSIGVVATIILSSYYFGTDTNTRVVTPLPSNIQKFSFYIHEPEWTDERIPAIAEMHRKRGHLQVYDMDKAHFIWSKR